MWDQVDSGAYIAQFRDQIVVASAIENNDSNLTGGLLLRFSDSNDVLAR